MERMKVVVLFGGCSSEHEVSLQSAHAVIKSLSPDHYEAVPVGITREGVWLRYDGPKDNIANDTWEQSGHCFPAVISPDRHTHGLLEWHDGAVIQNRIDVAFPVLHGKFGEDGTVQGLLELAGIPYAGCGVLSSAMCMDKDVAHRLVQHFGIQTPPSVVLYAKETDTKQLKRLSQLKYPLFVKPAGAGSSLGVTKVSHEEELEDAIDAAFSHDGKIIVEQAIDGFEVGCAVLGNDTLLLGKVDEIELEKGFFDYTEKYQLLTSKIHVPARIDDRTSQRIKQAAVDIYRTLCCTGFARIDMFLTPNLDIVFNEVNTIPGFTAHSRYPSMLKTIGIPFESIVDSAIKLALQQ